MRKLSAVKIKNRVNIAKITKEEQQRTQMLTESVTAKMNHIKDGERELIETYIRESLMFGNTDEVFAERVNVAVKNLMEMVDIKQSIRSTAERTGNARRMLAENDNFLSEGDPSYNELMFCVESMVNSIDDFLVEDLKIALSESEDAGNDSVVYQLFSMRKKDALMEGATEENLIESNDSMIQNGIRQAKVMLTLENLNIRLKEGVSAADFDKNVVSVLIP